jgi:hypothetical protein
VGRQPKRDLDLSSEAFAEIFRTDDASGLVQPRGNHNVAKTSSKRGSTRRSPGLPLDGEDERAAVELGRLDDAVRSAGNDPEVGGYPTERLV